jgi:hypothetical protein
MSFERKGHAAPFKPLAFFDCSDSSVVILVQQRKGFPRLVPTNYGLRSFSVMKRKSTLGVPVLSP